MGHKVEFAGVKLHEYMKILNIKKTILPPRNNFTKEIPSIHGELYTGYKYNPKKYVLECGLTAQDNKDFADKARIIAYLLDTKEPSKLILGDTADFYNYAVVDGTIDVERMHKQGKFEITFICHDPIGYSIESDTFVANEKKVTTIQNGGTTDAYPKVGVEFSKDAFFLQCTNYTGETILIGTPPAVDKPKAPFEPLVLRDNCEVLTNWNDIGNVLDSDREITGNLTINKGGYGICLGNAGNGNSWHGGAKRRNLGQKLKDFRVEVRMEHNSLGDLKGVGANSTTPPATANGTWVDYIVTAEVSLWVREGRGTNYGKLGYLKHNDVVKVTNIEKNWGQINFNGKTGYISMSYVKRYTAPSKNSGASNGNGTYKVNAKSGLIVRGGRGTNYKRLTAMPYGTQVYVSDISSGWGKVTYNGRTGYSAMQYLTKISGGTGMCTGATTFITNAEEDKTPSCENRVGLIEVYGYDENGTKLFKAMLKDSEQYYQYTEPFVEFGSSVVIDDGVKCPAPKTVTTKDDNGKESTKTVDGGSVGDWNQFAGWFTIERTTRNGKQYWNAKVEKFDNGNKVVKSLQTQTLNGNYPTGELSNIVIFAGGYNNSPIVDVMNVTDIVVTNLADPPKPEVIVPIFRKNDEVIIDNANQKIYKNGRLFMLEMDIGSQFFSSPVGTSQFVCQSDDENISIVSTIQKKWL